MASRFADAAGLNGGELSDDSLKRQHIPVVDDDVDPISSEIAPLNEGSAGACHDAAAGNWLCPNADEGDLNVRPALVILSFSSAAVLSSEFTSSRNNTSCRSVAVDSS